MPASAKKGIAGVRWVKRAEMNKIVDVHAKRVLGISGEKFISQWKAGKFRKLDADECPGVIELALLADLPRRPSGRKDETRSR